ncbi:hypothetical protein [Spirillospora sp. CA-294931]|uniref:hypothetical protein n=1 Tax=Spirillospora sp. CA-294931 TaxID=3240042 RepID=UPI003D8A39D9
MSDALFEVPDRISTVPPHQGIIAIDISDYSARSSVEQRVIAEGLEELLETSFARARLTDVWAARAFPSQRGDGYSFGFDPGRMPEVIASWLAELQHTLSSIRPPALQIRMQVALHIGPLPADGRKADGAGTARNDTARLLNSRVIKALIAKADPEVTRVVAILSEHCYEVAVVSGHALPVGYFRKVVATVQDKGFEKTGWIHIPCPSANLLDERLLGKMDAHAHETDEQALRDNTLSRTINTIDQGNLNSGTIHGDQTFRS